MPLPADVAKSAPLPDFSKFKFLPKRTDIVYRNNAGYSLTVDHLPWGKKPYRIQRYRISDTQNLAPAEAEGKTGNGGRLELSGALKPDAVELIVLNVE
jgi:hypothetical protein